MRNKQYVSPLPMVKPLLPKILFILSLVRISIGHDNRRIIFPGERTSPSSENSISFRAQPQNVCYVGGQQGKCVDLMACPELMNFIKSRNGVHTPGTGAYLKSRICKRRIKSVDLCCLSTSESADTEHSTPTPPSVSEFTSTLTPTLVTEPIFTNGFAPDITQPTSRPAAVGTGYVQPSAYLPSMDECGITTIPRIIKGTNFRHGTHPWLVGIGFHEENVSLSVHCGGTLITKRHVLSAAHCFIRTSFHQLPELTHVILGEHSLSQDTEVFDPLILKIEDIKHPGYDRLTQANDIALLRLEMDVEFTSYIRPACLPFEMTPQDIDFSARKPVVAGWGRQKFNDSKGTDEPLEAEVSWVPRPQCRAKYSFLVQAEIDDFKICFGTDGKDSCKGDSGGPLIYIDFKKYFRHFLIGVVNFGRDCGNPLYPGVYSYVPKYLLWINGNL